MVGSVQMLASGIASVVAGLVVTIAADGKMEHYNLVGYGAAVCGLLTFWLVGYIHSDSKDNVNKRIKDDSVQAA
jgi:hypothetical protein